MKRKFYVLAIALVGIVFITMGVTMAFFNYGKSGTTENIIRTGDITFIYEETDKMGSGISITDALPMSDSEGITLNGNNNIFNFKIKSKTTKDIAIPYIITARYTGDDLGNIVKIYLTEVNGNDEVEILEPTIYNSLSDFDDTDDKVLKMSLVPSNTSNYEKKYRLRIWISDKDINGNNVDMSNYNNKSFSLKVNVESKGHIGELEENSGRNAGSYTATIKKKTSTTRTMDLAWEYEGTKTPPKNFPRKSDGYIVTSAKCNGQDTEFDNDIWKLEIPPITGDISCSLVFNDATLSGLAQDILNNAISTNTYFENQPTLTTSSNNLMLEPSGLYVTTSTNSENPTYYFRGNVTNNYVDFAGFTWRIVRINEDGTLRIILDDDTVNISSKITINGSGKMDMYYTTGLEEGTAKYELEKWFKENITDKGYGSKVSRGEYFCEQAKTAYDVNSIARSGTSMQAYNSEGYTPDFTCDEDNNERGLLDTNVGLLTYEEVLYAGGYSGAANPSYFLKTNYKWWTISASGIYGSSSSCGWYVGDTGSLNYMNSNSTYRLRPVINLKANVTAIVDSETGHYVVQ